jgi:hypothetical protein
MFPFTGDGKVALRISKRTHQSMTGARWVSRGLTGSE